MSEIRVVVVSDRRLSGLALAGVLDRIPGASVVAAVGEFADAKGRCERGEADAVLVDASVLAHIEFGQHQSASPELAATYLVPASSALVIPELSEDLDLGWSFEADLLSALTPREREVFDLLGAGLSNAHIGILLGVSQATVKSHVGRILAKLKLESRLQAGLAAATLAVGPSLPSTA